LTKYWQASHTPPEDMEDLNELAEDIIHPEEE
jgi:hypothetical protein